MLPLNAKDYTISSWPSKLKFCIGRLCAYRVGATREIGQVSHDSASLEFLLYA